MNIACFSSGFVYLLLFMALLGTVFRVVAVVVFGTVVSPTAQCVIVVDDGCSVLCRAFDWV